MGRARNRASGRAAATAGALAVLTACGGTAGSDRTGGSDGATSVEQGRTTPQSAAGDTPAPGYQFVSSLGLVVEAPDAWPINAWYGCSPPPPAQVLRGEGSVGGCGSSAAPQSELEVAPVREGGNPERPPVAEASPATVSEPLLDGVPARLSRAELVDGRTTATLTVPSRHVELTVVSPDAAVVDHALASARLVTLDPAGCPTERGPDPEWDRRRDGPGVDLAGAGAVTEVAVCQYRVVMIEPDGTVRAAPLPAPVVWASIVLTGPEADAAVTSVDQAAAGPVPDAPANRCLPESDRSPLWLQVRYSQAPPVDVRVRYSTCTDRWTATAQGSSNVTEAQLKALLLPLHSGYGYPAPLPAR